MTGSDFDAHERARWSGRAAAFDRSFARLCAHPAGALLDAAGTSPGTRLLDVGTGTGTVAALAMTRGATVSAADAEPTMLALAADRLRADPAAAPRPDDVTLLLASLPVLPFDAGSFDATVANFVVNHVGDPAAAVAELARVTRAGGRVALTVWPVPAPTAQRLWGEVFDAAGVVRPTGLPRLAAGNDFARTEEGVAALLRGAGLTGVVGTTLTWTLHIAPDDWWAGPAAGISVPGLILEHQSPAMVEHVRAVFDEVTAPYLGPDGRLALPAAALLASGAVP